MSKIHIGLALTASCCCYEKALAAAERLGEKYSLTAILSENAAAMDSRFGSAAELERRLEAITGRELIKSIPQAEPIGPRGLFDVLVIAPCTASTAAKLALGICDGTVTMAAKSQLRGGRPVLLAFGSNDGLGAAAENIGRLLGRRNIFFLPLYQDDPENKPRGLASDYSRLEEAIHCALQNRQIQPILVTKDQIFDE